MRWKLKGGLCAVEGNEELVFAWTKGSNELSAVDEGGRVKWMYPGRLYGTRLLGASTLLSYQENAGLRMLDARTGAIVWKYPERLNVRAVPSEGLCVGTGWDVRRWRSTLLVASVPPQFKEVWRVELTGAGQRLPIGGNPIVVGGTVVIVDESGATGADLVAYDLRAGHERWRVDLDRLELIPGRDWDPHVLGRNLVFRLEDGLAAVDPSGGGLRWKTKVAGRPGFGDEQVVLAYERQLTICDARDGRIVLRKDLGAALGRGNEFTSAPLVLATHVFVGDLSGALWAFERESCEPVWSERPTGTVGSLQAPRMFNGRLYAGDYTMEPRRPHHLYCWEPVAECEVSGRPRLAAPLSDEDDANPTAFVIEAVAKGRQLASRSPFHAAGGEWSVYRCRMRDGGAVFHIGDRVKRGSGVLSGAEGALWVDSVEDRQKLLRLFRKAAGMRGPRGTAAPVKAPVRLSSVNLSGPGEQQRRKWTVPDDEGTELIVEWDLGSKRGGFIEKDELYRKGVLRLIAGLVSR